MTVLIKVMEMPENCVDCRFCDNDAMCVILGEDLFDYVQTEVADHIRYLPDDWKCDTCPLVLVPTPHGRLKDADVLIEQIRGEGINQAEFYANRNHPVVRAYGDCYGKVVDAPTIIEAEE